MRDLETVAFIGAGQMATAMANGLLRKGFPRSVLKAYDVSPEAAVRFEHNVGVKPEASVEKALEGMEVVILAVKPQKVREALPPIRHIVKDKLLLSIVAGVKTETLSQLSGCNRVVRVMPNMPALVGEGMSVYCVSSDVRAGDIVKAERVLGTLGLVSLVKEDLLDAVTGLSGSGPAFVFEIIQALADGGVKAGMSEDLAMKLAAQTVLGAAKLVLETGRDPAELRDQVATKGGTTERGLLVFERCKLKSIVEDAVVAATERSKELGRQM